jgi:hypothetical protein
LRRPPAQHPEYRLDRLLKRKAEEGVKIYIVVYKVRCRSGSDRKEGSGLRRDARWVHAQAR